LSVAVADSELVAKAIEHCVDDLRRQISGLCGLEKVLQAANRASDLVKQILTYSRTSRDEQWIIEPHLPVREGLQLLRAILSPTISIRQKIQADCGLILGEPTQIQQVLINLCTNAAQALGAQNAEIYVELKKVRVQKPINGHPHSVGSGSYARLKVKDTGPGMDRATMERIFEPFFTTKGVGEGTGMGLAVVHGIVTNHKGVITLSSKPGQGCAYSVYFPLYEGHS